MEIDEGLHSRQLAVWVSAFKNLTRCFPLLFHFLGTSHFFSSSRSYGGQAMKRMAVSNILISGLKGLGAEIGNILCFAK